MNAEAFDWPRRSAPAGTLFAEPAAPVVDPPTQSHDATDETRRAALRSIRHQAGTLRAQVLSHIRSRSPDGATDEETQQATGLRARTEGPRRIEQTRAGLVVDSGRRRPTTSGRAAPVWVANESAGAGGAVNA